MNIAIIGYGKMGHEIEQIANNRNVTVRSTIDPQHPDAMYKEINEESLEGVDVAIDFTHPSAAMDNIKKISENNVNLVFGTTGWYDKMDEVKDIIKKNNMGFIWSGNFSIGVNLFFRIIENSAKLINNIEDYDIFAHEFHHNQKADSPSGTAEMIGNILIDNIDRKGKLVTDKLDRKIEQDELHLSSTRGGSIPGTHIIGFDSPADTIELKHTARNRQGFALGAVLAAEFLDKKKGFYSISDLMDNIIGGK